MRLAERLFIDHCLKDDVDVEYVDEYAEPGYSVDDKGILLANWNEYKREREVGERLGYNIEWSDEWTTCDACMRAIRTSGTSYGWFPYYVIFNRWGEEICRDCMEDCEYFQRSLLEELENNSSRALPEWFEEEWLVREGYQRDNKAAFELGLHPHQTDDPSKIYEKMSHICDSVVFQITDRGQFDISWIVWFK